MSYQSLLQRIHDAEKHVRRGGKGKTALFFLYIAAAFLRAIILVSRPSSKGFSTLAQRKRNGTWAESYQDYVKFQHNVRFFSFSSVFIILCSVFIMTSVLRVVFPTQSEVPFVQAADNEYTVINNNDSGAGSLRQAISNANVAVGTVEITFNIIGPLNVVTLATPLPALTRPVTFVNSETLPVTVDGSALAAGQDCWTIASGADDSVIVGMAFRYCPGTGLVVQDVSGITLGGVLARNNIYAFGNDEHGIDFGASNSTLTDIYVGWPLSATPGEDDENELNGLVISGDNNTLSGITAVQNKQYGIAFTDQAEDSTLTNSFIGVRSTLSVGDLGNWVDGLFVQGPNTIIGQPGAGNVISDNGANGVYVQQADGTMFDSNIIGINENEDTDKGNTQNGIVLNEAENANVHDNVISGNDSSGILINGGSVHSIVANDIGTTSAEADFGNANNAISVTGGATSVSIGDGTSANANTLFFNDGGGIQIVDATTKYVLISNNRFNNDGLLEIDIDDGANDALASPAVSGAGNAWIQGVADGATSNTVHVYAGGAYMGAATLDANDEWMLEPADVNLTDFSAYNAQNITALQLDSLNNTSEFSEQYFLTTQAATLSVTDSTTFASTIDVTATLGDTGGTLYYTTDNTEPTLSSASEQSPFTFVFSATTTLKIFGQDANGNSTAIQTETYTKDVTDDGEDGGGEEGDGGEDGGNDGDGGGGEGDGGEEDGDNIDDGEDGGDGDGGNDDSQDQGIGQYLQSQNVTINDLRVYSAVTPLYVSRSQVLIEGKSANPKHEVRVIVRNANGNSIEAAWVQVKNDKWEYEVEKTLRKGSTYTIHARARVEAAPNRESEVKKLATVIASNPEPTITTLEGDYTVTARPDALSLGGVFQEAFDSATFQIQDVASEEIVDECSFETVSSSSPTKSGICQLDSSLPVGDYLVLFQSLDGDLLSAPDHTRLVVTDPVAYAALNLDQRNTAFLHRITTDTTPQLVGIGPAGARGRVLLDGVFVGSVQYTSLVNWTFELDLSSQQQGQDHLLEVLFTNPDNGERLYDYDVSYPFKYANVVVDPQLKEEVPQFVEQGALFTLAFLGGAYNTLFAYEGGTLVDSDVFDENIAGVQGDAVIDVPTNTIGDHTISFFSEDTVGLQSTTLVVSYSVVSSVEEAIEEATTQEENGEQTTDQEQQEENGESGDQTDEGSEEGDQDGAEGGAGEEGAGEEGSEPGDSGEGETGGEAGEGGGEQEGEGEGEQPGENGETGDGESGEGEVPIEENPGEGQEGGEEIEIPEEWLTPPATPEEEQEIRDRLETFNTPDRITVEPFFTIFDDQGNIVRSIPVEIRADGLPVLYKETIIGLQTLPFFGFFGDTAEQGIVFQGKTDPYAEVRLIIRSDPIVRITRADANGEWKITVPVDVLPEGEHTAYVQTTSKGVTSEEIQIAKFVVVEEKKLSNTTWIFIVNISIALVVLLAILVFQIRHRAVPVPVAQPHVTSAMPTIKQKKDEESDDDSSHGGALGV